VARSYWSRALGRFLQHRVAVASLIVLVLIVTVGRSRTFVTYASLAPNQTWDGLVSVFALPRWKALGGAG
jgi:hypothetical protein